MTAYRQAIVIGTFTSRASLKRGVGIVMGGATREDPGSGGGRVEGSLFGGNLKREDEGSVKRTCESPILLVRCWLTDSMLSNSFDRCPNGASFLLFFRMKYFQNWICAHEDFR